MKSQNIGLVMAGALFVALVLLVPSVAAQAPPTVTVDTGNTDQSTGLIRPELETKTVRLAFNYDYNSQAYSLAGFQKASTTATLNQLPTCNPNILVSGATAVAVDLEFSPTQPSARKQFQFDIGISVTRDLPGLRGFSCQYSVTVAEVFQTFIPEVTGGQGSLEVRADYFSLLQASAGQQIRQAGPQRDVPFEIQVENLGNARTTVTFDLADRPPGGRWVAAVPDDMILASPTNPVTATTGTAIFTVTTTYKNGWNNEQGLYRVTMSSYASEDPSKTGVDINTNVILRVRGVYVPMLEPLFMLGAVLGAALVVRARSGQDDEE